jgi:hypothetical protein
VFLAGGAVALGQEQIELLAQALERGFGFAFPLSLVDDQTLQGVDIIGQISGGTGAGRHGGSLPGQAPLRQLKRLI